MMKASSIFWFALRRSVWCMHTAVNAHNGTLLQHALLIQIYCWKSGRRKGYRYLSCWARAA